MSPTPLRRSAPLLAGAAAAAILALPVSSAHATPIQLNWFGTITEVFEDTGTTNFSGTMVGDLFSGNYVYDDQPGTPDMSCDSTKCEWFYTGAPYGAVVNGVSNPGSSVLIENDQDLSANPDDLDLINSILEPDIDVNTPFDIWELSSEEFSGDIFEIVVTWITTDTSTISDASMFQSMPPFDTTPAAGRGVAFFVTEITTTGSFSAFGRVGIVPVPAAVWLFGSALGLLVWTRRRASLAV